MSKAIEILLLADRPAESLIPLGIGHSLPLLPVANKPIVEHLLETIALHAAHALVNVLACISPVDRAVQDYLNNWAWPDVSIVLHDQTPRFVDRPTLVLRGDIFPAPLQLGAALMQVFTDGELKTDLSRFGIEWLEAGAAVPAFALPDLEDEHLERFLPDLTSYHRLAIAAARGAVAGLNPGGWLEDDGLRTGLGARVKTRRAIGPHVEVGANACVEHDVLLGGHIVIGEGAHVARGAQLENAIVLPNTYVGRGLLLKDTVVSGDWVCRVESGAIELAGDLLEIGRLAA
jgi:mannose-1-phosphate guanylyltransferase/phosphomannomutase